MIGLCILSIIHVQVKLFVTKLLIESVEHFSAIEFEQSSHSIIERFGCEQWSFRIDSDALYRSKGILASATEKLFECNRKS